MANDLRLILEKLNDLIALDMDAVSSYEAAIARIGAMPLKERLLQFQRDHERHVSELTELVRAYHGTPRTHRDMKGYAMQALTAVTSMIGDEAALRAMRGNEEITNRIYRTALEESWPARILTVLERNYEDEQRHLMFVKDLIAEEAAEELGAPEAG